MACARAVCGLVCAAPSTFSLRAIVKSIHLLARNILVCFSSLVCAVVPACANGAGSYKDIKMTPERDIEAETRGEMRAEASEVARLMNIDLLVEKVVHCKNSAPQETQIPKPTQQARLLCLWKIFIALEEVRKVVANINFEIAASHVALDSLTSKSEMTTNLFNTFNFMQGGILGATSKAINFKYGYPHASKEVSEVGFGIGAGLPGVRMLLPNLWSRQIDGPPNSLTVILNESYKPNDAEKSYLWKFLTSPIPGSPNKLTRREILIKHWEAFAKLNSADERLIKRLSANPTAEEKLRESIRVISQRLSLLYDLKSHVEEFDASLYELHKVITMNLISIVSVH
jgi:hypothetical protein